MLIMHHCTDLQDLVETPVVQALVAVGHDASHWHRVCNHTMSSIQYFVQVQLYH